MPGASDGAGGTSAEQSAGRPADDLRAAHVRAYDVAEAAGDPEAMAAAALALAATRTFGTVLGRVPAFLFEAHALAEGSLRARLAVALARAWAYSGHPDRAAGFAAEAQASAERLGDGALLADALDAQLAVHWGPDDLDERLRITARLEDTAAHLTDVEARLSAHLWRLSTALETLDSATVRRQLRALDLLADESGSPRVAFFAASRRGMHALTTGDLDTARAALRDALATGRAAGEADVVAIEHTLREGIARQEGDTATMAAEAVMHEAFGLAEGIPSIGAWGAVLWVGAGEPERARAVLHQLAGGDFTGIARDVDWLLTTYLLTDVATALEERGLVEIGVELLRPYAGRGVIDAGGVAFAGVVDAVLARCCALLSRPDDAARWSAAARAAYRRMGATWLLNTFDAAGPPAPASGVAHLRPGGDGIWWVGRDGAAAAVRDMRGLHYLHLLLQRPGIDVPALELSDAVAGHAGAGVVESDAGELLDRQALSAYRRRLTELDDELDEARAHADLGREERLDRERDALLDQLRAATGLGGRARVTGGTHERARVAVRKAIAAAVDRVAAVDPALGRLLRDTVSTGAACRYDPDPDRPVRWVLQPDPAREHAPDGAQRRDPRRSGAPGTVRRG